MRIRVQVENKENERVFTRGFSPHNELGRQTATARARAILDGFASTGRHVRIRVSKRRTRGGDGDIGTRTRVRDDEDADDDGFAFGGCVVDANLEAIAFDDDERDED